ncbi:B12-binding domain-containing radical SAM protein [Anaeromicrobium sediminis]|uniref:Uncharacterized protein n=1 Tax=Anaeromicrobium sediminis TaxID=1478221 RepID=A0A267MJK3_9FIRM|nr:radical SAM protein [Anaeromicrobium sediminis]PAB59055.1 hypothetical protein CCE28_12800 [Anaeromicrobium sediminis]
MKVCLIKASAESEFKKYKKYMGAPPQNIFSVAACTPSDVHIEMVDETMDMKVNFETNAEIIGIFMSTPDAIRAYELAFEFRKRDKIVVLGGLHPTFNKEEAIQYGDVVIVGEAEGIWEELLEDYKRGTLKTIYERETPVDMSVLKSYPTNIIDKSVYKGVWSVLVSRGCNNRCAFCAVHPFFGNIRYRPVEAIVEEIKNSGASIVELHSDNLTSDREYAKKLFKALIPLKIKWVGETTILLAEDDELLKLAAESGLTYLLVGIETPSNDALKNVGKGFVSRERVKEYIKKFHQYGIAVDSAMLFGFDEHDETIFHEVLKFVDEIELDVCHSVIAIPFPGTKLFETMEKDGRLITRDWSKYDGRHTVYKHPKMSPIEIEKGVKYFEEKTYTLRRYLKYLKVLPKFI